MEVHKIDYGQRVYQGTLDAVRQVIIATMLVIDSYNGETIGEPWISDRDEYVAGTTPSTGAQVAYTLDEPLEIPVAISNLPIRTLSGYNHIESSTGEMEVEYFPAKEQPLIDLIPEASNMHTYSTAEHAVGTWIDGSDVYERVYDYSSNLQSIGTSYTDFSDIDTTNISKMIYACAIHQDGTVYPAIDADPTRSNHTILGLKSFDSHTNIAYVILRYTKQV